MFTNLQYQILFYFYQLYILNILNNYQHSQPPVELYLLML